MHVSYFRYSSESGIVPLGLKSLHDNQSKINCLIPPDRHQSGTEAERDNFVPPRKLSATRLTN